MAWHWLLGSTQPGSGRCNHSDMLIPSDFRFDLGNYRIGLRFFDFVTLYALLLSLCHFFRLAGFCRFTLSIILRDWYFVNTCLRATSLLNEIFRNLSNFENFVGDRVPLQKFQCYKRVRLLDFRILRVDTNAFEDKGSSLGFFSVL